MLSHCLIEWLLIIVCDVAFVYIYLYRRLKFEDESKNGKERNKKGTSEGKKGNEQISNKFLN